MPNDVTQSDSWAALTEHQKSVADIHMRDLFAKDKTRFDKFHVTLDGLLFDYSKHRITDKTMELLVGLARTCNLESHRDAMFAGEYINTSENRAVLHAALRGSVNEALHINGESIGDFIHSTQLRIKTLSDKIRNDDTITDVISIGIGGSDLGPQMLCAALENYADGPQIHFISNVDGAPLARLMSKLKAENTVVLIFSKTFTTTETMTNAKSARDWLVETLGVANTGGRLFAATENVDVAKAFGVFEDNIIPMREWIGGRYSLWGGVGLPIAVACGFETFNDLLQGARTVDEHFKIAPLEQNIPVLMGLLGIWYRNFFGFDTHAVLPYIQDLKELPAYIQQVDMESNGKSVMASGESVTYATGPVIFGGPGTNAQHAFFQHMHQGTDIIPADFIAAVNPGHGLGEHHTILLANALAQTQALMQGNDEGQGPHRQFPGNRPSSTIMLDRPDAFHLGMLLALYEHKVFVQGCIWGINSFDQWGVELGKKLAEQITNTLKSGKKAKADCSTNNLIEHITLRKTSKNS